jgi:hypothetical protein
MSATPAADDSRWQPAAAKPELEVIHLVPVQRTAADHLTDGMFETVRQLAEEDVPGLWDALSAAGKRIFASNIAEAGLRPPEETEAAIGAVLRCWLDEWRLVTSAPEDDEPVTEEEESAVAAAEARRQRGDWIELRR